MNFTKLLQFSTNLIMLCLQTNKRCYPRCSNTHVCRSRIFATAFWLCRGSPFSNGFSTLANWVEPKVGPESRWCRSSISFSRWNGGWKSDKVNKALLECSMLGALLIHLIGSVLIFSFGGACVGTVPVMGRNSYEKYRMNILDWGKTCN